MKELSNIPRRNVRGKKTLNPGYEAGNHWVICDVCGCAVRANDSKYRWDGAVVCQDDWEPRHAQDFVRGRQDRITPQGPIRPDTGSGVADGCEFIEQPPLENEQATFALFSLVNTLNDNDNFGRSVHMTETHVIVLEPGWDVVELDNLDEGRINIYDRTTGELETTISDFEIYPGVDWTLVGYDSPMIHDDTYLYIGVPQAETSVSSRRSGAVLVINMSNWTIAATILNPFTYYTEGGASGLFGYAIAQDSSNLYVVDKHDYLRSEMYIYKITKGSWTVSANTDLSVYENTQNSWGFFDGNPNEDLRINGQAACLDGVLYLPCHTILSEVESHSLSSWISQGFLLKLDTSDLSDIGVVKNPITCTLDSREVTKHNLLSYDGYFFGDSYYACIGAGNSVLDRNVVIMDLSDESVVGFLYEQDTWDRLQVGYSGVTATTTGDYNSVLLNLGDGLDRPLLASGNNQYLVLTVPDPDSPPAANSGYVVVYSLSDLTLAGKFTNPDYNPDSVDQYDNFGYSIHVNGNGMVVGAWSEDSVDGLQQDGAAYVFDVRNFTLIGND